MAYADQKMSGNKVTALIIVALIHIVLGYLLVTGLAYSAVQKAIERVTTVDVKEDKPKEPPPPPPKKQDVAPPPVAPPVKINVAPAAPTITTVAVAPPVAPPIVLAPPAPVPAPPPPAPKGPSVGAQPRGRPADWATTDDYPARALREERQGSTGFRVTIGADGRVTGCTVTSSSGSPDLDQATCTNVTRRARFKPAMQDGQPTAGSYSNRITWVIPKN